MPAREMSIELVLNVLIVTTAVLLANGFCPTQKQSDTTKFTTKLGSLDYVRYGRGTIIPCCAEGYTNISWYRLQNGRWESFPPFGPTGNYNTPKLEEHRQVLRIYSADDDDSSSYLCNVTGKSGVIQHITELNVIACDKLARGPIPTKPFPRNQTIYQYGGNITLHCAGYFGCFDEGDIRLALWEVEGIAGFNITNISPRYSQQNYTSPGGTMLQSTLTIRSVQKEDVERTFLCVLATAQEKDGQTRTKVKIFKKDKPIMPWLHVGLIIGGVVTLIVLIGVFVCVCSHLYGPRIRLFCSSRIGALGPKTIDSEKYIYNLFIYHAEDEDGVKAQEIKRVLIEKNYKVCIYADLQGNNAILNEVFKKMAECAVILFLYSDDLRQDNLANFILQALINGKRGKDILILEVKNYNPREVMEWTRDAKEPEELGNGRNIEDDENDDQVDDGGTVNVNLGHTNQTSTENNATGGEDLKFWKVLPRIKVPADKKSARKMENFWCSLQNKIPKFVEQKQLSQKFTSNKQRNSSSTRPLLQSTQENESLTPRSPVSPTGDEVFIYEEANEMEHKLPHDKQGNGIQTLVRSDIETGFAHADHNPGNDNTVVPPANTQLIQNESGIVRGEIARERENDLVYLADVHHNESSDFPGQGNVDKSDDNQVNIESHSEKPGEVSEEETELKSKEEIFTMSDEVPKIGSFDSESSYTGENRSGRGTTYQSSEIGDSSQQGVPSSQSSGFSDFISEGSVSPPNCLENAYTSGTRNGQLPASGTASQSVKSQNKGNRSGRSPESGYDTSPSERTLSNGEYLQRIKE